MRVRLWLWVHVRCEQTISFSFLFFFWVVCTAFCAMDYVEKTNYFNFWVNFKTVVTKYSWFIQSKYFVNYQWYLALCYLPRRQCLDRHLHEYQVIDKHIQTPGERKARPERNSMNLCVQLNKKQILKDNTRCR